MRLVLPYLRFDLVEMTRRPMVVFSSVAFPLVVFAFLALRVRTAEPLAVATAAVSVLAFGGFVVVLFQFGVGIAEDRAGHWDPYLRTLATGISPRLASRVLTAGLTTVLAAVPVVALSAVATNAALPVGRLPLLAVLLLLGAVPFGCLGVAVGYAVRPDSAVPVANLLLFPLAFGGGMFERPGGSLPALVETVSPALPTRNWIELLHAATGGDPLPLGHAAALVGWTVALAALAVLAYRRNEDVEFR